MISGINRSIFSIITSGVLYSATGAIILMTIRNTITARKESKFMKVVGIWLSVIMMAAVTADQLSGRLVYTMNQRVTLGIFLALVFISACIVTYLQMRKSRGQVARSSSLKNDDER